MASPLYLLDTNILVALIRAGPLGQFIDATYQLRGQPHKPLICAVTKGEVRSLARLFGWGSGKRQALLDLVQNELVSVDIDQPAILDAYEELDWVSLNWPGGARILGKNDLWIAAVARGTGATLLTTDTDFDHLHPVHLQVVYIDPGSKLPTGSPTAGT
jgi:predicted nucleic acid-binding protein